MKSVKSENDERLHDADRDSGLLVLIVIVVLMVVVALIAIGLPQALDLAARHANAATALFHEVTIQ